MTHVATAPEIAPVRHAIHVPVEPARAFDLFTARVRDWWDPALSVNPTKAPIADVVLEPHVGGRWYERGVDGSECDWARVLAWEPNARLVVDWSPNGRSTELEVRFDGPAPRRTDVTLVHRGFERFGEAADRVRAMHDAVWPGLLARYATLAAERRPARDAVDRVPNAAASAPHATTDGETVVATADVPATPERVFRALTTTEVERWWGAPDTYRVTDWHADLRVGGRWSCVVRLPDGGPDGGAFPASGEFLALDAPGGAMPHRIVQTRRYDWDYPELGRRDTTVTYQLDPVRTGTRVTVRHGGFAGLRAPADHHVEGWEGFLGYLAAYFADDRAGEGRA